MKISEQEKQVLDSLETSVEIGIAIREVGRCSIGDNKFMKIWEEPTPAQLEKIENYAIEIAQDGEEQLNWGCSRIRI
jgi:hypothetical protein